ELVERLLERLPLNELHAQELLRAPVRSVLVDRDDVRVLELPVDARLLDEPVDLGGLGDLRVQYFDGNVTKQMVVERLDDDAGAATEDAARGEPLVVQGNGGSGSLLLNRDSLLGFGLGTTDRALYGRAGNFCVPVDTRRRRGSVVRGRG